jgi:hypothetical protein
MVFRSDWFGDQPGTIVSQDRFRTVELGLAFRKITCYRCDFSTFYKYRIQQVRRHREISVLEDETLRGDHLEIWKNIPRYAEIPETLKCRRCNEVLGLYTSCIY